MTTDLAPRAGAFRGRLTHVAVGRDRVALWQVDDLAAHVDREAVLRVEEGPEPPYWAHLWSGARVLAAVVPPRAGRVVELGCGLGLPALVAALRGAEVLATDRQTAPLRFVRASARANGLSRLRVAAVDLRDVALRRRFDVALLAEVLYDRTAFGALVRALDRVLAPAGVALLADGRRIDTTGFYAELAAGGFVWSESEFVATEDGFPVRVRLARITRRAR